MSKSLSLLLRGGSDGGGGGDEGGGVIGVFVSAELWSTKLSFPSVVDSSSTSARLVLISLIDVPLLVFVPNSECSVSSKAVFGRGVLLHVSVRASGYFDGRVLLSRSPNSLPLVDE